MIQGLWYFINSEQSELESEISQIGLNIYVYYPDLNRMPT